MAEIPDMTPETEEKNTMTPDQQEKQFRIYAEKIRMAVKILIEADKILNGSKGNDIMMPIVMTTGHSNMKLSKGLEEISNVVKIQEEVLSKIPVAEFVSLSPKGKEAFYKKLEIEASLRTIKER